MLSGAPMLRHIGEGDAAGRLQAAIAGVVRRGEKVTFDSKPTRNEPSASAPRSSPTPSSRRWRTK